MAKSLYKFKFRQDLEHTNLCTLSLEPKDVEKLEEAIEDQYYFEFVVDDIPIRNFIGHVEEGRLFPHTHKVILWTHYHFVFEYNGERIINANVTVSDGQDLTNTELTPLKVAQTFSVKWIETSIKYEDRLGRKASRFFPVTLEIHWLSVINSTVLAFLLVSFVVVILTRIVKKDFARYTNEDPAG